MMTTMKKTYMAMFAGIALYALVFLSGRLAQSEIVYEEFYDRGGVTVADIKELTRRSADIIVGKPLESQSIARKGAVKPEEAHIIHQIQVQATLKGGIESGAVITLKTSGGIYIDSADNVVNRHLLNARPLREGKSYFIFMKKDKGGIDGIYIPALGIQSIFEIEADTQTVIPCEMEKDAPVVRKYLNAPFKAFWEEILYAVSTETRAR